MSQHQVTESAVILPPLPSSEVPSSLPQKLLVISKYKEEVWRMTSLFTGDYDVLVAESETDAFHITESNSIDMILTVIPLSDMYGEHAIKLVAAIGKRTSIPFVVMTQVPNELEETRVRKLGALDYFGADTSISVIYSRIRNQMALLNEKKKLEIQSTLDLPTGLANRAKFDMDFEREWRRASRGLHPLSLVLIDIDQFKLFNDSFGHIKGDQCLAQIARQINLAAARREDTAARYGGEEFAIILPFIETEGAQKVAQSLCDSVRKLAIPHSNEADHQIVTISIGVSTFYPRWDGKNKKGPLDLLSNTDECLYRAKNEGRNRICC